MKTLTNHGAEITLGITEITLGITEVPAVAQERLVRLRVGAQFWMDFQGWTWPDCPHGDPDLVFVATPATMSKGNTTLRGQGFGNSRPHYGNGRILAEDSDVIDLPNANVDAPAHE